VGVGVERVLLSGTGDGGMVLTTVSGTGVSVGAAAVGTGVRSPLHANSRVTVTRSKVPITAFMDYSSFTNPEES